MFQKICWQGSEKQKPRSALFASQLRDCGRGNSPEAAPKQMRGRKGKSAASVHLVEAGGQATHSTEGGKAKTSLPQRVVIECGPPNARCREDPHRYTLKKGTGWLRTKRGLLRRGNWGYLGHEPLHRRERARKRQARLRHALMSMLGCFTSKPHGYVRYTERGAVAQ